MSEIQRQMADLGKRTAEYEARLASASAELADLTYVMLPFITRYEHLVAPPFTKLLILQRHIADLKAMLGDKEARRPGQAATPLDRFSEDASILEQYERTWHGKKHAKTGQPLNFPPASESLHRLYSAVIVKMHPDLSTDPAEKLRRRTMLFKVNETYARRDEFSLQMLAESYGKPSNLPAVVDEQALESMRERVYVLEKAINAVEGETFELRYGLMAKVKAHAEFNWAQNHSDLIIALVRDLESAVRQAQGDVEILIAKITN
jgi:hypothetical protein